MFAFIPARYPALITAAVILVCASAPVSAQPASDDATIRSRLTAYAAATQTGDAAARMKFYADDADIWLSTTKRFTKGRPAIEQELNQPRTPGLTFALDVENVTFLKPDIATVDSAYRVGIGEQKIVGHVFYVMVKRGEDWMIRSVRATQTSPAPQ